MPAVGLRSGWYREVAVKGLDGQLVRALITARSQLVAQRVDLGNQIRGLLKPFGLLAGKGVGKTFAEKVRSLVPDGPLHDVTEALLRAWEAINKEVATLSRRLVTEARQDDTVCRLMTAPGVGVLVALTYVSTIGDPARFPPLRQRRRLCRPDAAPLPVGRNRLHRQDLALRRPADAHIPV